MQIDELILRKRFDHMRMYDREIKFIYLGRKEFDELINKPMDSTIHVDMGADQVFFYGVEVFKVYKNSHIGVV